MNLSEVAADVYLARGPIASIGSAEIAFLRDAVQSSTKGRVRINLHANDADSLHEMFIAIRSDSYIRPHKHIDKSEAFHVVYGEVDVVVFEDNGDIKKVVSLSASGNGDHSFYYRMSGPFFHTLLIRSDILVVHEITNGPFNKGGTVYGSFSPPDDEPADELTSWRRDLEMRVRSLA